MHAVAESPDHDGRAGARGARRSRGQRRGAAPRARRRRALGRGLRRAEVAEAEGGDPLPAHEATKIIGEVLAELD